MTKIISGRNSKKLAAQLSKNLKLPLVGAFIDYFADGELRIQLAGGIQGENALIVQSTSTPVNDHLMELLLLAHTAKRLQARKIIALVPYLGYSRQDQPFSNFGPISAQVVATLIEAAGIDHLITLDLHSEQTKKFFKIDVQNIEAAPVFAKILKEAVNLIIVSPDKGGNDRAHKLSLLLGVNFVVMNKMRKSPNTCQIAGMSGDVTGKHCVLIDDIIDTGHTLCKAAEFLMQAGAFSVEAMVTHAVLSRQAIEKLEDSVIKKITVTNSIEHTYLSNKFRVIEIAPLLTDTLCDLL